MDDLPPVPELPFLPPSAEDKARMVRWATDYARQAVLLERERRAEQLPGEVTWPPPFGWLHDGSGNDPLTFHKGELPELMGLTCSTLPVFSGAQVALAVREAVERERNAGVTIPPAPGSEPFERWRKELRACIVQLLYVAHESKSPKECKANSLYSSVMSLVDGGPSLAVCSATQVDAAIRQSNVREQG